MLAPANAGLAASANPTAPTNPAADPAASSPDRPYWLKPGERSEPASSGPVAGAGSRSGTSATALVSPGDVFSRAASWLTANNGGPVPYSMDLCFPGFTSTSSSNCAVPKYRTDCSGFVSMALGLSTSLSTGDMVSPSFATPISKAQLQPGDLLVNPSPGAAGHVVLFEQWADSSQTSYWAYEQSGDGGTHHRALAYPYPNNYPMSPYHYLGLSNGATKLAFVKNVNTGSGTVEVHQADRPYQSFASSASGFSVAERFNGAFSMVGDKLVFIKVRNTGSNKVELHWRTAASGYTGGYDTATSFSLADATNGTFSLVGNDLVFIKTSNTGSGRVEVHKVSSANNYANPPYIDLVTPINTADAINGQLIMYGNDLAFVKIYGTAGKVEVHVADGSCNLCQWKVQQASYFNSADGPNGRWTFADAVGDDGIGDLVFIKLWNTGSGAVELFGASGASGYQQSALATATAFSAAEATNGLFNMNF